MSDIGAISNTAGSSLFPEHKDIFDFLGLLNSKVTQFYLDIISPTLNYSAGPVGLIPIKLSRISKDYVKNNLIARSLAASVQAGTDPVHCGTPGTGAKRGRSSLILCGNFTRGMSTS